jgi:hypothetical protein
VDKIAYFAAGGATMVAVAAIRSVLVLTLKMLPQLLVLVVHLLSIPILLQAQLQMMAIGIIGVSLVIAVAT